MAESDLFSTATIAERVGELIRVPSVNPDQTGPKSGDGGEAELANLLADRCDSMGAQVVLDEVFDGRPNFYAEFAGTTDQVVTIDVHLDTVGVEHMTDDPFDGRIQDDRVWGRGSVDTKASFAIVLTVLEEILAQGRPGPTVNLVGTAAEEAGGLMGAARYRDWLAARHQRIDRLIVAEPTMCAPVHGHKGGLGLEVTVHGHAAHSSKPHLGKNAVTAAARIATAIDQEHERLTAAGGDTPVGPGTVSVNEFNGGVARNIVPPSCELYVGYRSAPGEDPDEIYERLSGLATEAAAPLQVDIELANGFKSAAFWQNPQADLVQELARLAGSEPDVATYGSNALRYDDVVVDEMVVFGPGSIDQAHQAQEWISLAELDRAADVYRRLLRAD